VFAVMAEREGKVVHINGTERVGGGRIIENKQSRRNSEVSFRSDCHLFLVNYQLNAHILVL